jgi:O-antigen/teichoic acid export membrane protein
MSLVRTLARNVASNWAGYVVQVVVAFLLTPFVLRSIGPSRYGIWTLAVGLTGYYGLLDLGFSSGVSGYLTRYLAARDIENVNTTASTGFLMLTCCGFLVLVVSLVLAFGASLFFQVPRDLAREVKVVIAISGTSAALQFAFFTYSAVFTATQRFDLSNYIGIATRMISVAATIVVLKGGFGLVGLSAVVAVSNLIDYLVRWRVAAALVPSMEISLRHFTRRSLREIMGFGLSSLTIAGSVRLISYTDSLVIAAFMPVAAVAPFAVAANLRTYFEEIFIRAGQVFFPLATELDASGNRDGLREMYLVSSKFMFLGSILCGAVAIFWASDFFWLWIGSAYSEPAGYPSVSHLFYLLVAGSMVSVGQRIGYQVLLGMRRIGLLAALFAFEGICNLILSIILVRRFGLVGVALGTLLPAIAIQGFIQPVFVCRCLGISLATYIRRVLTRPFFVTIVLLPLLLKFHFFNPIRNWPALFISGLVTCALAVPIVFLLGLTKSEREKFLFRPLRTRLVTGISNSRIVSRDDS